MKNFFVLFFVFVFSSYAHAASEDLTDILSTKELAREFHIPSGAGHDLHRIGSVRLQIIVHKALVNETLEVILDGQTLYSWPTSTGRDQDETAPSGEHDYTTTHEGTFRIFKMVQNYMSIEWKAPMFDAMFFDGGIAIHGISADHYAQLGTPVSGGCVRLDQTNAATLWDLVHQIGTRHTVVIVTSR
jgi:lipoprotein-anchoring transpeptidase ErfK/SrfK